MEKAKKATKTGSNAPVAHGVGRRKSSVARAWLRKGTGKMTVNGRDVNTYFDIDISRMEAVKPFTACPVGKEYDVQVNVKGGGVRAQADAVKLSFARALLTLNEEFKPELRKQGLLTVDSRVKERKKYGQKAARAKFQFVKR